MEQIELTGVVESEIFHNKDSGFTVFSLEVKDEDLSLICVGNIPGVKEGEYVKLRGSYVVHAVYGKQLKVEHFERALPESELGIERYLASGAIKGIRAKMAKKIIDRFGVETLEVLEHYPERLAEIKGVTLERAEQISTEFREQNELRRTVMHLQGQGLSYSQAIKLYERYREATVDVVKENPYILAEEIDGIGFKTADGIARRMGLSMDSPTRIRAAIKYILTEASTDGHTYLPKKELVFKTSELLEIDVSFIENMFSQLLIERYIIQEDTNEQPTMYLNKLYYAEAVVAKKLLELSRGITDCSTNAGSRIAQIEAQTGMVLADNQRSAVMSALAHGVLVITGGPGTGKTTTIKTIIEVLHKNGDSIELAAPTGRAAKRMSEATGMEARTIHRLLEISFDENDRSQRMFGRNEDRPLEIDAVIIDESSMVDIFLMSGLLKAIAPGTRLILVGDIDQLPSVGPGNVLKDIIVSNCIHVVRLDEIFRQAQESGIVMNAHRINHGEYPILDSKEKDFFFIHRETPEKVIETLLGLLTRRLPAYLNCGIQDIQVLTPMRKSVLGVTNLNRILQQFLNPPSSSKAEKEFGGITFRQRDKVMQIKNNYSAVWREFDLNGRLIAEGEGVFNGDMGIIQSIDEHEEVVSILFDDNRLVEYGFDHLDELEQAYAITIHKSQGSEYKAVVMPIFSGPPMLMNRNLLYTGITRARELAVIVGIPDTLYKMVDSNRQESRYTSLGQRLEKIERFSSQKQDTKHARNGVFSQSSTQ